MVDTGDRYFATYFEVGYHPAGVPDWVMRWQWVAMPRHPAEKSMVIFSRMQKYPKNAAQWKGLWYTDAVRIQGDFDQVASFSDRVVRPPIVTEITLDELTKYVAGPRFETPWKVLERGDRQAQRLGFKIT